MSFVQEKKETLPSEKELELIDAYWRLANFLSVGQIYLMNNPLLKEPLKPSDIKPRLLGHFGTTPGINFIYAHFNRLICKYDLNSIFILGPGHGGPAVVANTYIEGTYTELYPNITMDEEGLKKLFKQFSFPGGIPSHAAPETPGSINEGGELGYCLMHAYGAAFDNKDLVVCCVIGDGEAETGPLAGSWHSNKFLNPLYDGAVLPILHLNGYKIASPTILARITKDELEKLFIGYGYRPIFVEGSDPKIMHRKMSLALEEAVLEIKAIQHKARKDNDPKRPFWPMIILRSPKGWTCPKEVDGLLLENYWRSHQVPITDPKTNPEHLKILENWLKSYRPEELFDKEGKVNQELRDLAPRANRRMGANPNANGGLLLKDLKMPDFRKFEVKVESPGTSNAEATRVLGKLLKEVMQLNLKDKNFRVMGPDETSSNRLDALFDVTGRTFEADIWPTDENLSADGRVMEVLSEHLCQGWLEGYLLTGRHGFFSSYEAFIHVVDSMFNQHAKWLKTSKEIPWRRPIASLNYLLTSHVWRQDHNGFSHQDPGFIDHAANKKAELIRIYLPPDANTLLSTADHCLRSRNYINIIIAGKQPALQYLTMEEAVRHCKKGMSVWPFASNDYGTEPDIVFVSAGDIPTLELLAAASLLREHLPDIKIRFVNVVDLMCLQPKTEHPHGFSEEDYEALFTKDKPVLFAFHGYPTLIHRLTYKRKNHDNLHVKGFKEEGTTTTPFDMVVLNGLDRLHLMETAVQLIPRYENMRAYISDFVEGKLIDHKNYIHEFGDDMPEIKNWRWPDSKKEQ